MKKGHRTAYLMILAAVLTWGFSFVSIKITLRQIPPMSLGLYRFIIAAVLLLAAKRFFAPDEKLSLKEIPLLACAGFTGVTLYFFGENNGVKLITASESSIIIGAIPVLAILSERIIFGKKLTLLQYIGAVLSFVGIWIIVSKSITLSANYKGYLFMAGAAVSWIVYNIMTRPLFKKHSSIFIVFWQTVFGTIGFIPFAVMEHPVIKGLHSDTIGHLLFLAVVCSAMGYLFYVSALSKLDVVVSSVFINLIPVVSVIFCYIVLKERLHAIQLIGGAVVVAGVYLTSLGGEKKKE
jgi:drug/metabolite transporter (DMT)-like permease